MSENLMSMGGVKAIAQQIKGGAFVKWVPMRRIKWENFSHFYSLCYQCLIDFTLFHSSKPLPCRVKWGDLPHFYFVYYQWVGNLPFFHSISIIQVSKVFPPEFEGGI